MPEITPQTLRALHTAKDETVLAAQLAKLGITVAQRPRDPSNLVPVRCTRPGCHNVRLVWRQNLALVSMCDACARDHKRLLNRIRQKHYQQRKRTIKYGRHPIDD